MKKKYMRRISPHTNKTRLTSYLEFTPMACFDAFHDCYSRRILLPAILIGFQLCKTVINTKLYFKPQIGAIYVNLLCKVRRGCTRLFVTGNVIIRVVIPIKWFNTTWYGTVQFNVK